MRMMMDNLAFFVRSDSIMRKGRMIFSRRNASVLLMLFLGRSFLFSGYPFTGTRPTGWAAEK